MSYPRLNFAVYLDPDAAEFPKCCISGFLMTYNTHLRDPIKAETTSFILEEPLHKKHRRK